MPCSEKLIQVLVCTLVIFKKACIEKEVRSVFKMNLSDYELRVQAQWKVSENTDLSPQFLAVTGGCLGK